MKELLTLLGIVITLPFVGLCIVSILLLALLNGVIFGPVIYLYKRGKSYGKMSQRY